MARPNEFMRGFIIGTTIVNILWLIILTILTATGVFK